MTHTQGPWQIAQPSRTGKMFRIWRNDEGPQDNGDGNTNYTRICRDIENPSDAHLIAASPELLATLKNVLKKIGDSDYWWMTDPDRGGFDEESIRAAIDRAEGRHQ